MVSISRREFRPRTTDGLAQVVLGREYQRRLVPTVERNAYRLGVGHRSMQQCTRRLGVSDRARFIAAASEPGRRAHLGSQLGAGPQREPSSEGKHVSVEPERHQERTGGGICVGGMARPQSDPPQVGKRNRRPLGDAGEGHRGGSRFVAHERHLAMTDFGQLVLLASCDLLHLADVPSHPVVRIGSDGRVGVEIQRVTLQPEHPRVGRRRFPAYDLRHPGAGVLGVLPLLSQVRLPEAVQQRLREPRHQRTACLGRGPEQRSSQIGLGEVGVAKPRIPQVSVSIAVRELQA